MILLLLFFRANIDEVETEVVEIEAKLDKVRDLLLPLRRIHLSHVSKQVIGCEIFISGLVSIWILFKAGIIFQAEEAQFFWHLY